MTNNELATTLTNNLKDYISQRGHNESGRLKRSINFVVSPEGDIKLNAKEYIKYLERGNFLNRFFELKSTKEAIAEFYKTQLLKEFNR